MSVPVKRDTSAGVGGDDHRLRRDLGTVGLLFSAIGSIIGSGWLFGALNASKLAGPAAVISWAVGAIIIILIGLVYAELGTMFPHAGGVARYPHYAFGSFASYTTGWVTWIAAATVAPVEVLAALTYATNYIPFLTHAVNGVAILTAPGYGVAAGLMLVFSFVNIMGIRWFARANNVIVWWKLFIIILVVVIFLALAFNGSHFNSHGFAPFGAHGIFTSLPAAGIIFSYLGFRQGVELAGETKNPKRNVPLALIGSVVITGLIYIALQIAFIGAVPSKDIAGGWGAVLAHHSSLAFGPLAFIAGVIGLTWLSVLLYIDAFVSPADTGMIYTTVTVRLSYAMGRNRNAPHALAAVNERGVPWVSVILAFIVGLIFFLPFPSWTSLVGFVTSATVLSFGSGAVVLMAMRKQFPDRERPFRLAGGPVIPFLAFWASNLVVYWSGWNKDWRLFVTVLIGFVILGINQAVYRGRTPKFDFRYGWWILPWFGGLCLLSFLGSYPAADEGAGNLGIVPYAWAVLAVFSALIMWLAQHCRLPGARAMEIVGGPQSTTGETA
ncbi:MAG: APC family permease [Sciscionella sp.]